MVAWVLVAALYILGALNMAFLAQAEGQLRTRMAWFIIIAWPVVSLAAVFDVVI